MDKQITESAKSIGICAKDKIVVAVSGGVDSVVLLDLMAKNFPKKNLLVAHINHGLRSESEKEEQFVANLARKYGIAFESTKLNLKNASEETSRIKRYEFLHQVKERFGAKYIAIAHHLNDQAETVLLKLTRGTGPTEVWGMKEIEADLWRPLLSVPKKEIEAYAKKKKLKHVTDSSNKELKYARNRIRHNVVPELAKINPQLLHTIAKETALGQELENYVLRETEKALKKVLKGNALDTKKLFLLDPFLQKQVIFEILKKFTPRKSGIYQKNVEEILKIARVNGNKKTSISGFTIVKNYDKIVFDLKDQRTQKEARIQLGKNEFNGWVLNAKKNTDEKPKKSNVLLPLSMLKTLKVRTWKSGDKIKTQVGTKKIQDIFTDSKITAQNRTLWPIVTSKNEIVWVPGLQASIKALQKTTKNNLMIEVKSEKRHR